MQRTAMQGSPGTLTAVTGTLDRPARRARETGVHPFRKRFGELRIGDASARRHARGHAGGHRALRRLHRRQLLRPHGPGGREANPFFEGRVAHGYFVVSLAAGLFVDPDPGRCWPTTASTNLRFLTPVYPGDALR